MPPPQRTIARPNQLGHFSSSFQCSLLRKDCGEWSHGSCRGTWLERITWAFYPSNQQIGHDVIPIGQGVSTGRNWKTDFFCYSPGLILEYSPLGDQNGSNPAVLLQGFENLAVCAALLWVPFLGFTISGFIITDAVCSYFGDTFTVLMFSKLSPTPPSF